MLNSKRPHFFQGFDPASSSQLLKIPTKFVKHMEGRTSGSVSLTGPSGNTWHVDLIQCKDDLFLHDGWAAFVTDHLIARGDSLVFRYDGDMHFTAQIFDQSSCEKETAFGAICSQDHSDKQMGKKRERENTSSRLDDIFECVPKKARGCVTVAETCDPAFFSNETENSDNLSKTVTYVIPLQSRILSENSGAILQKKTGKEDGLGSYAGGCVPLVSASEAERVSRSFSSSFPYFVKVMKRFNVSGSYTLNIPYQFSTEYLPKCKVKIVLHNLKGESWTVNSIPTTRVQTSHTFCGGWMAFVRDNNIEIGDICIFELVRRCELRVQILWVGKEGQVRPSGSEPIKGFSNGTNGRDKTSEHLPKKMKGNSRKSHLPKTSKVDLSGKKRSDLEESIVNKRNQDVKHATSKNCPRSKASKGKREAVSQNKSVLNDNQGSHTKGCMSMKSGPEEKRAAQLFISNFPHFVRIMKKFNISGSYTLKIPYQFSMAHLPNSRTEIVLRNLKGECWTVNSVPTKRVQTLHTFCGGWMAFVRGNDIQMGDICIFELIGKCEMRVHISGVGKKGLDYQGGNAASNDLTLGSSVSNQTLFQDS